MDIKITPNKCQQEFERWAIDKYPLQRLSENGEYKNDMTTIAYHAWCAAWEASKRELINFINNQKELPAEFQKVLSDNREDLYED